MIIKHNLTAMGAQRQYDLTVGKKKKTTEKLSSGYRINRAADDAASLAISEKMRRQIRGLNQGTLNGRDGISWVQVGDGALSEVSEMMHRMKQLTIHSLNDTLTEDDRAALQAEFSHLQFEIDRIATGTHFNNKNVFSEHESTYYVIEGNRYWEQSQFHTITAPNNTLTIECQETEASAPVSYTISVPPGRYTTQELIDEIDDAMYASGYNEAGISVEYTQKGMCNVNYEGGEDISSISGGLSYLFYDTYDRGSAGALLGTTIFHDGYPLKIKENNNDLIFTIEDFVGNQKTIEMTIPDGYYSRQEIIDILNQELAAQGVADVEAREYGDYSIQLIGEEYVVTGLKGDMFKIDDPLTEEVLTSVFYDNIKYGSVHDTYGYFKGGAVLTTNTRDTDHNRYVITDNNNVLMIRVNGETSDPYVRLEIPNGSYTADHMASIINTQLQANGLEATAKPHTEGSFQGITLESLISGVTSKIEFDVSNSSAYQTLFTKCTYATISTVNPVAGAYSYSPASVTGGKSLGFPLNIDDNGNEFKLNIGNDTYTIELSTGQYTSMADLISEIDKKLNGADAPLSIKGKITVSSAGNKIKLEPETDSEITRLSVSGVSGNTGYQDLFVGTSKSYTENKVSSSGTETKQPEIAMEIPFGETIDGSNDKLTINVDGVDKTVTLPHGEITESNIDDIIEEINNQLGESTVELNKSFEVGPITGTDSNRNSSNIQGSTSYANFNQSVTGTGEPQQGSTWGGELTPAKATMPVNLPASMVIDSSNSQIVCKVNGSQVAINLTEGTYNRDQLVAEIQAKFDAQLTTQYNGVNVSLEGNRLCFTTKLEGKNSSLEFSTLGSGTFIAELCTTKSPAQATLSLAMKDSISIDGSNNTFQFKLNGADVSVNIAAGTYNRASLAEELNRQFELAGFAVKASLSGSNLRLTTTEDGAGKSVSFSTSTLGSSSEAIYGKLKTAASATIPVAVQDNITIDASTNQLSCTIDGTVQTITIPAGDYTSQSLVDALNSQLAGMAKVTLNASDQLVFTSLTEGTGSKVSINSQTFGSSLSAIFGTKTKDISGVTASYDGDGKLVLTGDSAGDTTSLLASSLKGSANPLFLPHQETITSIHPEAITGALVSRKSYIDGANLSNIVSINSLNKDLSFYYNYKGTTVSFSLDEKDYTHEELKQVLQEKIDAAIGSGEIEVKVDSSGVVFEATRTGSSYNMLNFSGGFHKYVISGSKINTVHKNEIISDGEQIVTPAYAIGRQDVKNNAVEIKAGTNDILKLDVTIDNQVYQISITLDEGVYQGDFLANHIQGKLNEALEDMGLQRDMIKATIGGYNSGVAGADDSNSLIFSLSKDLVLDNEGDYIIDGVSGSAAFYVFYKTNGSPIPTYITGAKDITDGVSITSDNNTFSFVADDVTYNYTIPEGDYTAEEFIDKLNELIEAESGGQDLPIVAMLADGNLKLSFTKFGVHSLHSVSGTAKGDIFYQERGEVDGETKINIKLSGQEEDWMEILKPRITTTALGINSVAITQHKYAEKALERLNGALYKLLTARTDYGARQNRLEHAVASNENTSENLTAAEARIRDADMAKEMVEFSKSSIVIQAAQSMLAQANQERSDILQLLQ